MSDTVLEQDVRAAEEAPESSSPVAATYEEPVVVSFSLDPHGVESGDALTANG